MFWSEENSLLHKKKCKRKSSEIRWSKKLCAHLSSCRVEVNLLRQKSSEKSVNKIAVKIVKIAENTLLVSCWARLNYGRERSPLASDIEQIFESGKGQKKKRKRKILFVRWFFGCLAINAQTHRVRLSNFPPLPHSLLARIDVVDQMTWLEFQMTLLIQLIDCMLLRVWSRRSIPQTSAWIFHEISACSQVDSFLNSLTEFPLGVCNINFQKFILRSMMLK